MTSHLSFEGSAAKNQAAAPSRRVCAAQRSLFIHPSRREHADTVFFLEREVTVAFTTPQNSPTLRFAHVYLKARASQAESLDADTHSHSSGAMNGCRGANRTLIASFKDSCPAIERPGNNLGSSGENRTPISALKGPHPGR